MKRSLVLISAVSVCTMVASVALTTSSAAAPSGSLALNATVVFKWGQLTDCPAGVDPSISSCVPQTAQTVIPGLGAVSLSGLAVITETPLGSDCWLWRLSGALAVARKGEIDYTAAGAGCQKQTTATLAYTLAGGTGTYAGASGSGTLAIPVFNESTLTGVETWTGALTVPGVEFDVIPPTLSGARNKTVKAPRKAKGRRVTYKVTATDAVEGSVPVVCKPRLGSRFKVGKTVVRCSATDSSGNVARASFKVTVRR